MCTIAGQAGQMLEVPNLLRPEKLEQVRLLSLMDIINA